MHPKDAEGIANSVDHDHTAPLAMVDYYVHFQICCISIFFFVYLNVSKYSLNFKLTKDLLSYIIYSPTPKKPEDHWSCIPHLSAEGS